VSHQSEIAVAQSPGLVRRALPYIQFAVQLTFAAALLCLLLWRVDLGAVRDDLRGATLWWLPLAYGANLASDFFRAVRWREFFRPLQIVNVWFLWAVAVLGVACNLALPMRAGEFVRFQVLRKRTGLKAQQVLATILSEKLMDTVAFSAFLIGGLLFFEEARFLWPLAVAYTVALIAGVVAARWLSSRSEEEQGLRPQLDGRVRQWIWQQLLAIGTGLGSFRNKRSLLVICVASLLAWLCEATMYFACGRALGIDVNPAVYLLVVVAATVAVSVPLTQGGLGVFEVAITGLLVAFGVDEAHAAAFAIFSHVMLAIPYFMTGPLTAFGLRIAPSDLLFFKSRAAETAEQPAA
jgi:hypothetical protein